MTAVAVETRPTQMDPAALREVLAETDAALLLNCLVQLTGDVSLRDRYGPGTVQRPNPTRRLMPSTVMPEENAAAVRDRLVELLVDPARAPEPALPVPETELLRRMAELAVGQDVGEEFVPLPRAPIEEHFVLR